jgi:hypothetical protein
LPKGVKLVRSKVPKDWHKSPVLNKGFYSFGSKTNIRENLKNLLDVKTK